MNFFQSLLDLLKSFFKKKEQQYIAPLLPPQVTPSPVTTPVPPVAIPTAPPPVIMEATVTMPVTGHVLPVPQPDKETFINYVRRVSPQASPQDSNAVNGIGTLYQGTSQLFKNYNPTQPNPDGSNWPQGADRFYNQRAYMTPEELLAEEKAKQAWRDAEMARIEAMKALIASGPPKVLPPGETQL